MDGVVVRDGRIVGVTEQPAKTDLYATLNARAQTHGDYSQHAEVTQALKRVMHGAPNWGRLSPAHAEALDMVAHKIGRILAGDPNTHDHWHDLAGYATLAANRVERE
jgi:hypothetical protein